jgi:hypothetical protein
MAITLPMFAFGLVNYLSLGCQEAVNEERRLLSRSNSPHLPLCYGMLPSITISVLVFPSIDTLGGCFLQVTVSLGTHYR